MQTYVTLKSSISPTSSACHTAYHLVHYYTNLSLRIVHCALNYALRIVYMHTYYVIINNYKHLLLPREYRADDIDFTDEIFIIVKVV